MIQEHTVFSLLRDKDLTFMLTLIVVPTDIKNRTSELIESFAGVGNDVVLLQDGKLDFNVEVETIWKMFMYEGEFLAKDLQESLPTYLRCGLEYDVFSVYKNTNTGISVSPRLFKANVKMKNDSVYPEDKDKLKWNTILDGFILSLKV